jgi:uncharacterized RDD family membrane protein YckC
MSTSTKETTHTNGRFFHPHHGNHLDGLDGLPLARFWQRALGYFTDVFVAILIWMPMEFLWRRFVLHQSDIELRWDFHEIGNIIVVVLYFAAFHYFGNGRTPGKMLARTRIVSLTSEQLGVWQSIERALGYGAAILEGGLGFLQFFWDKNRMCAQDRLAETIVIDVRKGASRETYDEETEPSPVAVEQN